jgi:hypothetical protein
MATEAASLSTPAGQAAVTLTRTVSGAAARSALADAALAIGRGGLVGGAIAAGAALAPLLEQWMLDQGYHKNADGTFGVGSAGEPATQAPANVFCYKQFCKPSMYGLYLAVFSSSLVDGNAFYGNCAGYTDFQHQPLGSNGCFLVFTGPQEAACANQGLCSDADASFRVLGIWYGTPHPYCPDGSDPTNGGMCGAGTGGPASLNPADVHAAAAAAPNPATVTDWAATLDNAAAVGYPPDVDPTPQVSGPATVTGTSTVTSTRTITQPNGSTQTLNETSQQVSHLTYTGSQVQIDTHTVTSTQNPDGSTTTTDKPTATAPDVCAGFPNLLGCTQLGTPEAASVPTSTKTIAFTPEAVNLPSSCPPDISLGKYGTLSFSSACSNAATMRPLVLAVGAFLALSICVGAVAGVRT